MKLRHPKIAAGAIAAATALFALPLAFGQPAAASNGADGSSYYLDRWFAASGSGGGFAVHNDQGRSFSATYGSGTSFKLAALDRYSPVDPCRDAAKVYNDQLQAGVDDTVGFSAFTIPVDPCRARILLDSSGSIKSFQPLP